MTEVAPLVMRTMRHQHRPGAMTLGALDLLDHDVQRLIPTDPFKFRLAAVLDVAFAVGVEVHPLHGIQNPVLGIDHGLLHQAMGGQRGAARWRERFSSRLYRPGRRIFIIKVDRSDAYDLALPDIHEYRSAVGAVCVAHFIITNIGAAFPAYPLHAVQRSAEPDGQLVGAFHADLEILGRIHPHQLIERRGQELSRYCLVLEYKRNTGILVYPLPGAYFSVLQLDPASCRVVLQSELRDEVSFFKAVCERGVQERGNSQRLHHPPKNDRKSHVILSRTRNSRVSSRSSGS